MSTGEPNFTQEPPSKSDELASWVIPVAVVAGICILLVIIALLVYCIIVRKTSSSSSHVDPYGGQAMQLYAPQTVAAPMFPSWEMEQQNRSSTATSFQGAPMLQNSYSETQMMRGSSGTMMSGYAGSNNTANSANSYNSATSPQQLQGRPLNYSGYAGSNNQQGATFGEKAAF